MDIERFIRFVNGGIGSCLKAASIAVKQHIGTIV